MRTVLLHGFTGGATSFAHLPVDAVTPELPGHGSAPPATSWEDALAELQKLLDPGPVVLGGYSMGARLALALALRRPEKIARLVLASGTAGIEDETERASRRAQDEELARFIETHDIAAFVDRWQANEIVSLKSFQVESFQLERLRAQRLRHQPAKLAGALRRLGSGAQPSYWDDLHRLSMPVVLLAGARDPKFAAIAARMHARLRSSELRVVEECGHVIHVEKPEVFTGALR
ncbi:MAG: alpha/beta fold hydrolase [Myxococcales bacterium]|nr:alpha/beta fold hydrolase [Myxococcales bacterium]